MTEVEGTLKLTLREGFASQEWVLAYSSFFWLQYCCRSEQAMQVREQVAAGQKFRELVDTYWQACKQWPTRNWKIPRPPRKRRIKSGLQNGV